MRYRVSAKALILHEGRLLATSNRDRYGDFLLLPGGGQHPLESLHEALARECEEELGPGIGLEVGDLALVREYIGRNHEFAEEDGDVHQTEMMFLCRLAHPERAVGGAEGDVHQTGVVWIPLDEVARHRIYPSVLRERLGPEGLSPGPVYLGDVN